MLGAGTVINPIIKIVTTVAILAAAYFFIVKPTLDTTNDAIDKSFDAFDESFEGFDTLPASIQGQIDDALESSSSSTALQDCIQKAINSGNVDNIPQRTQRCVNRFGG